MIQRIRHMIEFLHVMPQQIMCITYTRTAGCNMEMRIKRELQRYQANLPMVGGTLSCALASACFVSPFHPASQLSAARAAREN
jgi:superfamily I DNA/RNA helicase